jgi:hypothetical protein
MVPRWCQKISVAGKMRKHEVSSNISARLGKPSLLEKEK